MLIEDMDKLQDTLLPIQIPYVIAPAPQILKPNPHLTQPSSDNLSTTRIIKTGKIQELVQS